MPVMRQASSRRSELAVLTIVPQGCPWPLRHVAFPDTARRRIGGQRRDADDFEQLHTPAGGVPERHGHSKRASPSPRRRSSLRRRRLDGAAARECDRVTGTCTTIDALHIQVRVGRMVVPRESVSRRV